MAKPTPATAPAATVAVADPSAELAVDKSQRKRLFLDRAARLIVTLGGIAVVAVIVAILAVLLVEVVPLFESSTARRVGSVTVAPVTLPARIGVDEYRELGYIADLSGVKVFSLRDGSESVRTPVPALADDNAIAVSDLSQGKLAYVTSKGKLLFCEVKFESSFASGSRTTEPQVSFADPIDAGVGQPVHSIAYCESKDGPIAVASMGQQELVIARVTEQKTPEGSTFSQQRWQVSVPGNGEITALAVDNRGEDVFAGTSTGEVARIDLRTGAPAYAEATLATDGSAVTALGFLLGHRTLIVGDQRGRVSSWQLLSNDSGALELRRIHDFAPHSQAVRSITASNRDKGFLTADEQGGIKLHYGTTGRTRLSIQPATLDLSSITYAPRADGFAFLGSDGSVQHYALENRHPEITLSSLFNKVWYEGDSHPEHTWQSTGGADDFEAKFGLMPLIYGTLKGSFYTLILSVPIAVLAALYASQFMRPNWKGLIKPAVEIMAGLPSVVLGFIAALWLAPNVETVLPGVLMMPIVLPVLVLGAVFVWRALPMKLRSLIKPGRELFALVPLIALGVWASLQAGDVVTARLIGGDYHSWLANRLGLSFDQRNSLVVSFAMGFAVIPIIFTIAEDAFTNVPRHLTLAARALGATKWQTALRVVVPTASPGIFSAIMVGLGRAVGETMIVLMATGNTPIMSWNIFNGFRALSANIAVELPEAPVGGTLYRVLFLTALLLFGLTFIVNTAAEVVRLRLRKRYSAL